MTPQFVTFILLLVILCGCNYAHERTPNQGSKIAISIGVNPSDVSTGSNADAGPPATADEGPSTAKAKKTKADVEAEISMYMIGGGIGLALLGVGLMVAAYKVPMIVPTWAGKAVIKVGACLIAWGSVSGGTRNYVIAAIVALGVVWMYRGSIKHNQKAGIPDGQGKVPTPTH